MNNFFRSLRVALAERDGKTCPDPGIDSDVVVLLKMDVSDPAVLTGKEADRTTGVFIVAGLAKKVKQFLVGLHKKAGIWVWVFGILVESVCNFG